MSKTTMTFEEFTAEMVGRLREKYPGCGVMSAPVLKNNGLRLTGITIRQPGCSIFPTIYIDDLYAQYLGGHPMGSLISQLADAYEGSLTDGDIGMPDVADFDAVKDLICFRLINYGQNREMLKSMPHRPFLDLAVTYYIPISIRGSYAGRIAVTDKLSEPWGVKERVLYHHASRNTRQLFPLELQPMAEVVDELLSAYAADGGQGLPPKAEWEIPIYVLRCGKEECATAAAMLYEPVLREFAERHGDFYILPSSIYEVILCPSAEYEEGRDSFNAMVRDTNQRQVARNDVLADHAYLYHAGTGTIEVL